MLPLVSVAKLAGANVVRELNSPHTDFGNVTYELPALHCEYSIPLRNPLTDANHTVGFAEAAKTKEAHQLTLQAAGGIAIVGARILFDDEYRKATQDEWKQWKHSQTGNA